MADWTNPPYAQLVAGKPWTDEKAAAAFENVVALAEGASGAPKIGGKAVDVAIGSLSGTTAITGLDDVATLWLVASASIVSATGPSVSYQLSSNGGSTWGSAVLVASSHGHTDGGSNPQKSDVCGAALVNMVGFNAIRLSGTGTISGSAICVKGV